MLDNCEHVVSGVAHLVRELVAMTAQVRVLTTSRTPLGLSSESVYPLPALTPPTAVELFGQRARAARPGVDLPPDAVAGLCRHLDGLPLAIELAAARTRTLSVVEITRRLDDRFTLLRGGARDAPERHQTLHAVVDWSWNLLDPAGRAALRALAVFPGGFTADAARHLLADPDVVPVLEDLVDQSLLQVSETTSGTRFRMLETVREFSVVRREAASESERAVDGLLDWAREFGTTHHDSPFGADPFTSLQRIRDEQDKLVYALRQGLNRGDGATVAATAAVLAALWTAETNHLRVATLGTDTAWLLSHFHPEADLVEATRTAATLCTANTFLLRGPRAVRSLVTLRRLPAAPPDTLLRALAVLLASAPEVFGPDRSVLEGLRTGPEPLLACLANGAASYVRESEGDMEAALTAAEAMLDFLSGHVSPWMRVVVHSRISELCVQVERGPDALRHAQAAERLLRDLGAEAVAAPFGWATLLATLACGDAEAADHQVEQFAPRLAEADIDADVLTRTAVLGVRVEIALARGEVDTGLLRWRRALDALSTPVAGGAPYLDAWTVETQAVAVVAHAQHDRLDLVDGVPGELARRLLRLLGDDRVVLPSIVVGLPVIGAGLLAVGMADLARGLGSGDPAATSAGARLVALAERLHFLRNFQPTMSGARARDAAEHADKAAYHDALSSYAALDHSDLRAAALKAVQQRGRD